MITLNELVRQEVARRISVLYVHLQTLLWWQFLKRARVHEALCNYRERLASYESDIDMNRKFGLHQEIDLNDPLLGATLDLLVTPSILSN